MSLEQIVLKVNPDAPPSGSDLAVVNAARRSFGKRSDWDYLDFAGNFVPPAEYSLNDLERYKWERKLKPQDKSLIEFLARGMSTKDFEEFLYSIETPCQDMSLQYESLKNSLWKWRNTPIHDTPFNHCFVSFEVQAPIFVHRHLIKTEYTLCSEFSRRYITGDVSFYEHDYREVSKDKKQGSGGPHKDNEHWQKQAQYANKHQLDLYNAMIDDGVAPEQARGQLPLDLMTSWTWSGTLGAMAKMCRERLGNDTQKETQYVAQQVYKVLKEYYPVSSVALVEGV